jgi:membrane protein required for beta-lactamase induction
MMHKFNVKIGLIKGDVQNAPSRSTKELIWYRILWGVIAVLICFAFWETQWFIQEFLLNIGSIVLWLLLVFSYYGVKNLYKNYHH